MKVLSKWILDHNPMISELSRFALDTLLTSLEATVDAAQTSSRGDELIENGTQLDVALAVHDRLMQALEIAINTEVEVLRIFEKQQKIKKLDGVRLEYKPKVRTTLTCPNCGGEMVMGDKRKSGLVKVRCKNCGNSEMIQLPKTES